MNSAALVFLSVALSSGVAVTLTQVLASDGDNSAPTETDADASIALADRMDRIESKLEEITSRPVEASSPVRSSVDRQMIEDAIASYFAKNGGAAPNAVGAAVKAKKSRRGPKQLLELVAQGEIPLWELGEHMRDLTEDERKQIVKHYADIAKANKFDADAQANYGHALIQKLLNAPIVEQAVLGQLADKQFDKALEINDQHWGARFTKAMSLSHWPAVAGKQPEAMKHFEILIEQQETQASQPQFTQSYVVLGNLYSQQGRAAEARKVWERGLKRFPNAKALKDRLSN